jgi:hypothetical protein
MKITPYLLSTFLLISSQAMAEAPKVEFFLTQYDGVNCLSRAENSLKQSGFEMTNGKYKGEDRVGVYGNYKGAIGCSTEIPTAVVFVVTGDEYNKIKDMARKLQYNFMNY